MSMTKIRTFSSALLFALSSSAQDLRTAGTLLVDVSAEALTANDGDTVTQWPNSGLLGGAFVAITNNAGISFTNSLLGKKAVLFNNAAKNALTNMIATPSTMTGSSTWSMEAWVWVPTNPAAKSAYLSWTQDSAANSYESSGVSFRYDTGNAAIDNNGSTVVFGYGIPAAGSWHHLAVVRNANKQEKVFVDGNAVNFSWCADPAQSGIPIALGAVKNITPQSTPTFSPARCRACASIPACSPTKTS